MYYPDMKDYITLLFFLLNEFLETKENTISRGRPKTYSDALYCHRKFGPLSKPRTAAFEQRYRCIHLGD